MPVLKDPKWRKHTLTEEHRTEIIDLFREYIKDYDDPGMEAYLYDIEQQLKNVPGLYYDVLRGFLKKEDISPLVDMKDITEWEDMIECIDSENVFERMGVVETMISYMVAGNAAVKDPEAFYQAYMEPIVNQEKYNAMAAEHVELLSMNQETYDAMAAEHVELFRMDQEQYDAMAAEHVELFNMDQETYDAMAAEHVELFDIDQETYDAMAAEHDELSRADIRESFNKFKSRKKCEAEAKEEIKALENEEKAKKDYRKSQIKQNKDLLNTYLKKLKSEGKTEEYQFLQKQTKIYDKENEAFLKAQESYEKLLLEQRKIEIKRDKKVDPTEKPLVTAKDLKKYEELKLQSEKAYQAIQAMNREMRGNAMAARFHHDDKYMVHFRMRNDILESGKVEDIMKIPLIDQQETGVWMDINFPEHPPVQAETDAAHTAAPARRQLDLTAQVTQQPTAVNRIRATDAPECVEQKQATQEELSN